MKDEFCYVQYVAHWAFPEYFRNPSVEDNHFQKSSPLEFYLVFHHPPPLEFHGNPLSSIVNPLEFSRFSFLRPPEISVILKRGDPENFWKSPLALNSYLSCFYSLIISEQMLDSYLGTSAVLEWRYSFSQAEMILADNIPEKALASYLALKAVIKTHINRAFDVFGYAHKIPSYALKTILFFEVEKLEESYWEQIDVEEEFFWALFKALRQNVKAKKCPHYWIETMNLFADMKDEDFRFMETKLKEINEQPVKYIASEWIEWNRYMQKNCCESCVNPGQQKRRVYGEDFGPVPCG